MAEQIKHHEPVDVHSIDDFVFVKCSCGRNPTPNIWLEEHFSGTDDLGKAWLDAVVAWCLTTTLLGRSLMTSYRPVTANVGQPSWRAKSDAQRHRRGHPTGVGGAVKTIRDYLSEHTDISDATGCWLWGGHIDKRGYGRLRGKGAHRLTYQEFVGPIPDGLDLDHLCRVTACVNPQHLEPVTPIENIRRRSAAYKACKHGHEFTPENTYRHSGRRHCRTCQRERQRRAPAGASSDNIADRAAAARPADPDRDGEVRA
jgi:hypothetical protein